MKINIIGLSKKELVREVERRRKKISPASTTSMESAGDIPDPESEKSEDSAEDADISSSGEEEEAKIPKLAPRKEKEEAIFAVGDYEKAVATYKAEPAKESEEEIELTFEDEITFDEDAKEIRPEKIYVASARHPTNPGKNPIPNWVNSVNSKDQQQH